MHARIDVNQQPAAQLPAIVFEECEMKTTARQAKAKGGGKAKAKAATRRREVKVGGKRVKTIDVHAHCVIPEALQMHGTQGRAHERRGPGIAEVGARRIARDGRAGHRRRGAQHQSVLVQGRARPGGGGRAHQQRAARRVLRDLSGPLHRVRVGRAAVSRARRGAARARGEEAGPARRRGRRERAPATSSPIRSSTRSGRSARSSTSLVFIHPQSTPELHKRLKGNGWLANTIGNPLDTTICLSHLIFEGTLDKLPEAEDLLGARRRLPAFVRAALGSRLPRRARTVRSERQAEEEADRVPARHVLRHAGLHVRSAAAPRGRSRRRASS